MAMGQNPVPLVNIKIAGKWVFIPLKSIIGGFDTHLYHWIQVTEVSHCQRKVPLVSHEDICMGKTSELEQKRTIKLMVMRLAYICDAGILQKNDE